MFVFYYDMYSFKRGIPPCNGKHFTPYDRQYRPMWPLLLWSVGSWISHYKYNQCISLLTLWTRIPFMARCTRYNFIWYIFSVTCDRTMVFSEYQGLSKQYNWLHDDRSEILLKKGWRYQWGHQKQDRQCKMCC